MSYAYVGSGVDGREHTRIAEKALGRKLPKGALVHHVNEDDKDNRNENLVICPSKEYHALLHIRMRALAETGNVNSRRCKFCQVWGLPINNPFWGTQKKEKGEPPYWHKNCANVYVYEQRHGRGSTS